MNRYISKVEANNLSRNVYPMPQYIIDALKEHDLESKYESRPSYQKNDYIGWITRAKREETKQKRLNQMLTELREEKLYMNMAWNTHAKS